MTSKKSLRCATIFPGCNFVAHGETDADVLAKMADHARNAHETDHISDALRARMMANLASEEK